MISMGSVFALSAPKITKVEPYSKDHALITFKQVKGAKEYLVFVEGPTKDRVGVIYDYYKKGNKIIIDRKEKDFKVCLIAQSGQKQSSKGNKKIVPKRRRVFAETFNKDLLAALKAGKTDINLDGYNYTGSIYSFKKLLSKIQYSNPLCWQFSFWGDDFDKYVTIKKCSRVKGFYEKPQIYRIKSKFMSQKDFKKKNEDVKKKFNKKFSGSNFEKAKKIHNWLIARVKYKFSKYNQNIYGAFQGECVCAGYCNAYKYMCDYNGVKCDAVYNRYRVLSNLLKLHHGWNQVKIGKKWYIVDCTSDDYAKNHKKSQYTWFLIGSETYKKQNISLIPHIKRNLSIYDYPMKRK